MMKRAGSPEARSKVGALGMKRDCEAKEALFSGWTEQIPTVNGRI